MCEQVFKFLFLFSYFIIKYVLCVYFTKCMYPCSRTFLNSGKIKNGKVVLKNPGVLLEFSRINLNINVYI